MIKIEKLTDQQISKFPEYVEKWTKIGLSTEPADRTRAETAIKEIYKISGHTEPKIVWCDSPLSAYLTILIIQEMTKEKLEEIIASVGDSVRDSVGASVWDSVGDSVRDSVWESVGDSVGTSVGASVGDSVRDSVRDSVWDSVGTSVGASVGDSVRDSVGASVWDSVGDSVRDSVWESVGDSVGTSVGASVWVSVRDSVWASVREFVRDSVRDSVWDSVMASIRASVGESVAASVGASVAASVWASARDSVWDSVGASVGASVWDSVWASVGASVWDSVRASVGDSVGASVWASVRDSVRDSVWDSVNNIYQNSIEGNHLSFIAAFYLFFRNECGLTEETENGLSLYELTESCGWIFPYKNICFASERHNKLKLDSQGRLHSESVAAVEYPDGYKIYAIHGVRVPEYIILNKEQITVDKIESEDNVEIRRIMITRYKDGPKSYLQDSNSILIDEQKDINSGLPIKLWKKDRKEDSPIVMVEILNKTKEPDDNGNWIHKSYYIRVKPDISDAIEAVAWHHNQTKENYLTTQKGT